MTDVTIPSGKTAGEICETCPKNFIIILGAPGLYNTNDPSHDRTWQSYYLTLKTYLETDKDPPDNEVVHVLVYSKGYNDRHTDDDHTIAWTPDRYRRNRHADNIKRDGVQSYNQHMRSELKAIAAKKGFELKYISISNKNSIKNYANGLNNNSIARLWFIGHATVPQLWLSLRHTILNQAKAPHKHLIVTNDILTKIIKDRIYKASNKISRFIGCNTARVTSEEPVSSAQVWQQHSGLKTLGYTNTIHFSNYERLSKPVQEQGSGLEKMFP